MLVELNHGVEHIGIELTAGGVGDLSNARGKESEVNMDSLA